jgi:hypothetical protein
MANDPNDQDSMTRDTEREGIESEDRSYDEGMVNRSTESSDEEFEDVDPDSAESEVDRDDTIDEP